MKQWVQCSILARAKCTCLCTAVPWARGMLAARSLYLPCQAGEQQQPQGTFQRGNESVLAQQPGHPSESQIHQLIAPCAARASNATQKNLSQVKSPKKPNL